MIVAEITRPNSLADKDTWSKATMIYTNKISKDSTYTLTGEWKVAFVSGDTTLKVGDTVTGNVTAGKYAVIILYQE